MKSNGLRTLIYMVQDLDAAKAWYSKAFGVDPYFDEPFYVGFNIGGYELGLSPTETPQPGKNAITYWEVKDVQNSFDEMLSLGATSFEEPKDVGSGIIVAAVLDPWGNALGMIYNPHFKPE